MKYFPLVKLAYTLILRPALKKLVKKTDNNVDDKLIGVIDFALKVELPKDKTK